MTNSSESWGVEGTYAIFILVDERKLIDHFVVRSLV
jgi:hypothetical protein